MLHIRLFEKSDSIAELTALLHRAYAPLGSMGLNYTAVDQTPETTAKRMQGGACFVAVSGAKLVGTILVQPTYAENACEYFTRPGVAAAHQFAVDPAYQRRGIGRMLLQLAEQWAMDSGFTELAMDTAEQATHLIELYARLGYYQVDWVQWPGKVYRSVVLSKRLMVNLRIDAALDQDVKLWRYMDLAKLISMLEQKGLWLARADTFRDKHEGRFPDEMKKLMEKAYEGFDKDDPSPVKDADDFQDYLLKNTFISCWHKNFDENMVMWEIYGRDNNAVAVQTTIGRLRLSIDPSSLTGHSLLLNKVTYQSADQVAGELKYEECFFRKRPHFSHEEEVRISLDTYSRENPSKKTPEGYKLPVDINGLIASILVHPDSPDWFVDAVRSIASKFDVRAPIERGSYGAN